jgi:putative component of membrane protein insertase Oxa1/YidC/SpoIIIJ protein YidD
MNRKRDKLIEDKTIITIFPSIWENRGIRYSYSVLNGRVCRCHPARCSGTENTNKYQKVKISSKAPRNE